MKKSPFILRYAAILLILVLSQKSGAGLFIHDLFHTSIEKPGFPDNKEDKGTGLSYACACIDDFLLPFSEPETIKDPKPNLSLIIPSSTFEYHIPYRKTIYSSFRGPPIENV